MNPARRPILAAILAALVVPADAPAGEPAPGPAADPRIVELEARVTELEAFLATQLGYGSGDSARAPVDALVLPVEVTQKRFESKDPSHGRWEDYLHLDVEYDTAQIAAPAAALKGVLEFADPFGEIRFTMPTQVNDRIKPASAVKQKGLRFKFNQFRDEHQWVNNTDPGDMIVTYRVSRVVYRDGTTEEYR